MKRLLATVTVSAVMLGAASAWAWASPPQPCDARMPSIGGD